jgi:membrane dipeptidase
MKETTMHIFKKQISYYIGIAIALLAAFAACKEIEKKPETEQELLTRAKAIHERVITLDTHCDINVANFTDSINYTQRLETQVNLPKMKEGLLDVPWFVVYTGQDTLTEEGYDKAYENAMAKFDAIHRLTKEIAPDQIELATSSADVKRIIESGKMVAMIGIENGYPVGTDISRVKQFYDLGARYMSLSHNGHSQLCDSNTGEADNEWLHNGVSDLGKEVIKEMNKYGMLIDVSHPSKKSIKDMVELSKAPIIASHSSDGGVVQTVAFRTYVNKEKQDARSEKLKEVRVAVADSLGIKWIDSWADFGSLNEQEQQDYIANRRFVVRMANEKAIGMEGIPEGVNVADFVDHIDYLVGKIGLEHVGISSDFDGGGGVDGWSDASETFNVTHELVKRGYTEEEISMLWSGNLLRVLDEAQAVAQKIQAREL